MRVVDAGRPGAETASRTLGQTLTLLRPATVRLNPQDHALLEAALQQQPTAQRVQWVADASVAPGGCLVEQAGMVIDGSLDKRWQRAIAPLGLAQPWEHGSDERHD